MTDRSGNLHGPFFRAGDHAGDGIGDGPEVGAGAVAVVLADAVAGKNIDRSGMKIERQVGVVAAVVADIETHRAGQAGLMPLFHHEIDDARSAVGLVLGRRVGDHLDLLDGAGRQLLQHLGPALTHQRGRAAVDQDQDVVGAAQADIAVDAHVHRWHVLQQVAGRAGGTVDVPAHVVDLAVDGIELVGLFRGDLEFLQLQWFVGQHQLAQVDLRPGRIDLERRRRPDRAPHPPIRHRVTARRNFLQGESAPVVRDRAPHDRVIRPLERDRAKFHRLTGLRRQQDAGDTGFRPRRRRWFFRRRQRGQHHGAGHEGGQEQEKTTQHEAVNSAAGEPRQDNCAVSPQISGNRGSTPDPVQCGPAAASSALTAARSAWNDALARKSRASAWPSTRPA